MELLGETQITCVFSSLVWSSTVDYTPCEFVFSITVFKCPYEIRQFCLFSFRAVFEGGPVQCISANPTKKKAKFLQFDINEFYPSISEELLRDSIRFAKNHARIEQEEEDLIMVCRNSILFND